MRVVEVFSATHDQRVSKEYWAYGSIVECENCHSVVSNETQTLRDWCHVKPKGWAYCTDCFKLLFNDIVNELVQN